MRIFVVGDSPTIDTGFGVVTKNLTTRWRAAGHEIAVLGVNEFGDNPRKLAEYDFPIYPVNKGGLFQLYGLDKVWNAIGQENPDIIFFLNDPWLIQDYLDQRPEGHSSYWRYVAYYPTDAPPMKKAWMDMLNGFDAQVCYSKYAERVVIKSNGDVRPDNLYQIYHGVDTKTFFPYNQSMARASLGIPTDLFIAGMVARNQPRKRFDLLMMAFAKFAKDKDDVKLYLHTAANDVGFDIVNLTRQFNLEDKLIFSEDVTPIKGVPAEQLNRIYNSFDVNVLISLGDGFGLPVAESMAGAVPQIVSGHSCLQELVEGHGGLTVKTESFIMNSGGMNTWGGVSSVDDIVKQLNYMYENPEERIKMAQDAYNFITQEQFTWDYAAARFLEIFKKVYHIL